MAATRCISGSRSMWAIPPRRPVPQARGE
jgi:hypothetical protein